jgi:hypothetical protein
MAMKNKLEIVASFKYPEITLKTRGKTFTLHVQDRVMVVI